MSLINCVQFRPTDHTLMALIDLSCVKSPFLLRGDEGEYTIGNCQTHGCETILTQYRKRCNTRACLKNHFQHLLGSIFQTRSKANKKKNYQTNLIINEILKKYICKHRSLLVGKSAHRQNTVFISGTCISLSVIHPVLTAFFFH